MDAVHSGCSGIVVYGGGDIVFGAKRSNQWIHWMQSHSGHSTQWMQYAVDAVRSAIVICDGGDAVCSGIVVYDGGDIVFATKSSNQWMQYTVDAVE